MLQAPPNTRRGRTSNPFFSQHSCSSNPSPTPSYATLSRKIQTQLLRPGSWRPSPAYPSFPPNLAELSLEARDQSRNTGERSTRLLMSSPQDPHVEKMTVHSDGQRQGWVDRGLMEGHPVLLAATAFHLAGGAVRGSYFNKSAVRGSTSDLSSVISLSTRQSSLIPRHHCHRYLNAPQCRENLNRVTP
jgi:hypothetical protein